MLLPNPGPDSLPKADGKVVHLAGFKLRHGICPFIVGHITLLPEQIELLNRLRIEPNSQFQRVDHTVVVSGALRLVTCRRQRGGGELQSRVVGDVELPVRHEAGGKRRFNVAAGDREQIRDLLTAWLVLPQPPEM